MHQEFKIEFHNKLFEAEEKTGLGLFELAKGSIGVYRQGNCLFIGVFEEACKYIFSEAGVDNTDIGESDVII